MKGIAVARQFQDRRSEVARPPTPLASIMSVWTVYWSAIVLSIVAVTVAAWFLVDPAPPVKIRFATGVADGFYDRLGRRFALALQRNGVDVELVPTAGSSENLALFHAEEPVDAAFVQGGVGLPVPDDTDLRALAALAVEPVWLFARDIARVDDIEERSDVRIAIGPEGSGTRDFMLQWLALTGLRDNVEVVDLTGEEAADALEAGTIDAAAFVTSPQTQWIRRLFRSPGIALVESPHIAAVTRHMLYTREVDLPARVIDYEDRIPEADITVLGVAMSLMVHENLHPAIKQLLLQISTDVARGNAILGTRDKFPNAQYVEYPLDGEAERFFRYGPTQARRYLPFWAANLIERFWVLVIPVATLIIPILRFGPTTLQWSFRRRIYRWYKDLREIEAAVADAPSEEEMQRVLGALTDVERQVNDIQVPLAFRDDFYRLRTHIAFVRSELDRLAAENA